MTVAMLVDPGSGRFISVAGGQVYAQGHAFLTALKGLPSFLAERRRRSVSRRPAAPRMRSRRSPGMRPLREIAGYTKCGSSSTGRVGLEQDGTSELTRAIG